MNAHCTLLALVILATSVFAQPAREAGYLGLITRNDTARGPIRVVQVVPAGPAALAGMRPDDLIVGVEGQAVRAMNDLAAALAGRAPGERISLSVIRGQDERAISVTLGRRPPASDGPALIAPQEGQTSAQSSPNPTTARRLPLATEPIEPVRPPETRTESARLDLLERRMAELERRLADLERLLSRRP